MELFMREKKRVKATVTYLNKDCLHWSFLLQ